APYRLQEHRAVPGAHRLHHGHVAKQMRFGQVTRERAGLAQRFENLRLVEEFLVEDMGAVARFYFSQKMLYAGLILQFSHRESIVDDIRRRYPHPAPAVCIYPCIQGRCAAVKVIRREEIDMRALNSPSVDKLLAKLGDGAERL